MGLGVGVGTGGLRFVERDRCICGDPSRSTVWQQRFDEPDCAEYLDRFGYAVAWREHIGEEEFELVRCASCEMVYHRWILDEDSLGVFYSTWIDDSQNESLSVELSLGPAAQFEAAGQMVKHALRLRSLLPDVEAFRVLDYGCGSGRFLQIASAFGFSAVGLDLSTTRQDQSERRGFTIASSLSEIDDRDPGPFHAVTMFQVLEHLADPAGVLTSLRERMAPDGVLVVEVPDCSGVDVAADFESFRNVHPLEHINAFTPATLKATCERAGFTWIKRPPAYVTTQVKKLPKTMISKFVSPPRTQSYFRKI